MRTPLSDDPTRLPAPLAERVLARAAELDAAWNEADAGPSLAQLRAAAREAGIASHAIDAALGEAASGALRPEPSMVAPPWWVRVCLFGVPDRTVAMAFYWLFLALTVVAPLAGAALAPHHGEALRPLGLLLGAFGVFALWSASCAIRWADRRGWDAVR